MVQIWSIVYFNPIIILVHFGVGWKLDCTSPVCRFVFLSFIRFLLIFGTIDTWLIWKGTIEISMLLCLGSCANYALDYKVCHFLLQADLLGSPVVRPTDIETTVLGAAYATALAAGVWTKEHVFACLL
jgi:hypothetical protein